MTFLFPPPGDIRYDEAMGYPMVQQWRVRSNLYRVKLSTITLSAGEDHPWCNSARVPKDLGCGWPCAGTGEAAVKELTGKADEQAANRDFDTLQSCPCKVE